MRGTELTGRAILMVVLVVVVVMGSLMATTFILVPSQDRPAADRPFIVVSLTFAVVALAWFVRLAVQAVRDRRRGVRREPAKVGGWFHICFGIVVALAGAVCSWLTYQAADPNGGFWTLYWGMIVWGLLETIFGTWKLRRSQADAAASSDESVIPPAHDPGAD